MPLKNLQVLLKVLHKMLNSFCHTQTIKLKVVDSSSSKIKLYSTFVVDGMTSNFVFISDRHKIKSAPKECISLRIPHVTVADIYSFLIIQVVLTFCGCTSSQLANTFPSL